MRQAPFWISAALLVMLAACGADGIPERPEPRGANAITLSGEASAGVSSRN
ncbi:argininosuccinate lyase [Rhodobacterales bacterium LSUCC0031]|nr:argininosuccinate lyase [Rhodobacterales bacterium LSUCC0031]